MTTTVETDRDAVRIAADVITNLLARDIPLTAHDAAEHVVRALLDAPIATLDHTTRQVTLQWPSDDVRVALVAREVLEELVDAANTGYAVRRGLPDALTAAMHTLQHTPPTGILTLPADTTDEQLAQVRDRVPADIAVERARTHLAERHAEVRAALPAKLAAHAARPASWPAPEVAVDYIDHTDEHVSPDCRAGKCGACTGDAFDLLLDALTECEHTCHRPDGAPSAP